MKATRMGFYFNIIGINFYFEGDFYLTPAGGCDHVDITGGSFLMKPALKLVLVGATEGWLVARDIAAAKVPVLVSPLGTGLDGRPARFRLEVAVPGAAEPGKLAFAGSTYLHSADFMVTSYEHSTVQW